MRNIHEESLATRQRGSERTIETLLRRGPRRWIEPDLLNGYANPGGDYGNFAYRHGGHWELEFDGYLSVAGATSDTVAFIMEATHLRDKHIDLLTSVRNGSGFSIARLFIDKDSGEGTFTWPAT